MENEDIISKLKFLSRVQKGEKINVKGMFIQSDNIQTTLSRTLWNTDSRQNTLVFIETTINNSVSLIDTYLRSNKNAEHMIGLNMLEDLSSAKDGIKHLKTTYNDDTMFCAKIDTFIQIIEAKISELNTQYNTVCYDANHHMETASVEVNQTDNDD
tara:strand:- start:76 stop:543 length:468 start_codon:yes stop_codon:yes gene_type:complete